ncbi:hypothetical protein FRC04_010889 [Tulasnella sp. 424]|nr:hypothetical protein FRC04_010889 [Tulasnella sp. 424]KAG8972043.1 hypothetical protein FRC05_010456 [Tulasnella sp. 425]
MARRLVLKPTSHFGTFTVRLFADSGTGFTHHFVLPQQGAQRWVPSLGLWGAGAGVAVALLMSATPLFKNDVLVKVPALGWYWEDNTPASDKPF